MDFPGLLDRFEKLVNEPDTATIHLYQQQTDVREDRPKWLVHQLFQVMSFNCLGDAVSRVRKCEGRLGVPESHNGFKVW